MTRQAANTFNTNVLRIALNMQEEKIACLLVANYYCKIDEEMILRSIKTNQLEFIHNLFLYNRNYQELLTEKKFNLLVK